MKTQRKGKQKLREWWVFFWRSGGFSMGTVWTKAALKRQGLTTDGMILVREVPKKERGKRK